MTDAAVPPRLIVANLDCEAEMARVAGIGGSAPRRPLPRGVRERISRMATAMRAFARDGDVLWTPEPVAERHLGPLPGLAMPTLVSGPLDELAGFGAVLAWGETPAVAALRARGAPSLKDAHDDPLPPSASAAVWSGCAPDVAAAVNDRAFALEIARELDVALPGARLVEDVRELEDALRQVSVGPDARLGTSWVLKARFSAAGRSRALGRGARLDPAERRRVERLFAEHGPLVWEPWLDRVEDFGAGGIVDDVGTRWRFSHRLVVAGTGTVQGVAVPPDDGVFSSELPDVDRVVETVGERLRERGYRGAFVVDGFRWRDPRTDDVRIHPLAEINARCSFGLVARVLRDRLWSGESTDDWCVFELAGGDATSDAHQLMRGDSGSAGAIARPSVTQRQKKS